MINLRELIVCRNFLDDDILGYDKSKSAALLIELAERTGLSGNLLNSYIIYKLAHEPNLVSVTIERTGGNIGKSLLDAFKHDIKILCDIVEKVPSNYDFLESYTPTVKNNSESLNEILTKLENLSNVDEIADILIEHYRKYGYGDIADYRAFRFDEVTKNLIGIKHFESIRLDDLIGYVHQKELLTQNTNSFIERKPANNVLLVGARGTGKSSSVKALVNENYKRGLRLVQLTKPQLKFLPDVMETLRNFAGKRFIIFIGKARRAATSVVG